MKTTTIKSTELAELFTNGVEDLKGGLEKVKASEQLFNNDPWFFDWIQILESRIKVLETAGECELPPLKKAS